MHMSDLIISVKQQSENRFKFMNITKEMAFLSTQTFPESGTFPLRWGLKVEEFAEEIKRTGHLLVEPFCRVSGNFVVNLKTRRVQTQICF